jgi:hypothetical protein
MTDSSSGVDSTPGGPAGHPHALEAIDDGGDEYTFVPRGADAERRRTQWLTADADAVVDLRAWR